MNGRLKPYIGTKNILAMPMTKGDYDVYRGGVRTGEACSDPGYMVEYTDGGKPNVEGHDGYISWSPAEVFEKSYQSIYEGLSFGHAIECMRAGFKVRRKWGGDWFLAIEQNLNEYPTIIYHSDKEERRRTSEWHPAHIHLLANDWVVVPDE